MKMKYPSGIRAISIEYVDNCERTWLLLTFNSLSSSAQVHITSTLNLSAHMIFCCFRLLSVMLE